MILVRSILARVAALIAAALATYGLYVGVPHILELLPNREGFMGVFQFPDWQLAIVALLIFSGGFYWSFRRSMRRRQKGS